MMKIMAFAGALALIGGLLLGLIPGSFGTAYSGNLTCGSPWVRDHSGEQHAAMVDDLATSMAGGGPAVGSEYRDECDDILNGRGIAGIVLASLGALTLLGVGLLAAQNGQRPAAPTSTNSVGDTTEIAEGEPAT